LNSYIANSNTADSVNWINLAQNRDVWRGVGTAVVD
jgi:hypothetical protein